MTTKPTYQIISVIDYASLEYDPNELEPLPDGMEQSPAILRIFQILDAHLKTVYPREGVFVDSHTTVCYNPDNLNNRVLPDLYFAFDVDPQAIRRRKLYLPWEAGKPPDFALEIGSESTFQNDMGPKRDRYAQIGISEYWRFDPTGGTYYNQPLTGEQLIDGTYQPFELTTEPDGILKGYSPALKRYLCWHDGMTELYDPETNTYHLNLEQALDEVSAERNARREAEEALGAQLAARQQAEARIRQLEEELERRQTEG